MAKKKRTAAAARTRVAEPRPTAPRPGDSRNDPAVTKYIRQLNHPLKRELEALRLLILGVSPSIAEGIKWNSPSFRTSDWFATINVYGRDSLRLILHTGAKAKVTAKGELKIADPAGLLKWLAKDRCLMTLGGGKDFAAKRATLRAIVRQWIRYV